MFSMFSGKRKTITAQEQKESDPVCLIKEAIENVQRQLPSPPLHRKGRTIAVVRDLKRDHLRSLLHIHHRSRVMCVPTRVNSLCPFAMPATVSCQLSQLG